VNLMSALTLPHSLSGQRTNQRSGLLWFGAACVVAGAAFSTFLWRRRLRAVEKAISPLDRAEEMIANCERKLDTIEKSVADIKEIQSDLQAGQGSVVASSSNGALHSHSA
jgi:hypothetical protein